MSALRPNVFRAAKAALALFWVVLLGSFFVPGEGVVLASLRVFTFVLLGVHALEAAFFVPAFKRAEGSLLGHLAQVLLFGLVHYGQVKAELDARKAREEA